MHLHQVRLPCPSDHNDVSEAYGAHVSKAAIRSAAMQISPR